jgi:hypothetical protein
MNATQNHISCSLGAGGGMPALLLAHSPYGLPRQKQRPLLPKEVRHHFEKTRKESMFGKAKCYLCPEPQPLPMS